MIIIIGELVLLRLIFLNENQAGKNPRYHLGADIRPGSKPSLVAQTVKNLPAMQETQVQSLGWEESPGEGNATHSHSCLENFVAQGAWQATYSLRGHKESDMTEQSKPTWQFYKPLEI